MLMAETQTDRQTDRHGGYGYGLSMNEPADKQGDSEKIHVFSHCKWCVCMCAATTGYTGRWVRRKQWDQYCACFVREVDILSAKYSSEIDTVD